MKLPYVSAAAFRCFCCELACHGIVVVKISCLDFPILELCAHLTISERAPFRFGEKAIAR